jgi:Phage portal protein, SPP1 Gp6-like
MTTFWERLQSAYKAAQSAWYGTPTALPTDSQVYRAATMADAERERVERYKLLWQYYRGEHRKHLKVRMTPNGRGPDDNLVVNLSRRVVNKGVYFLFGKPLVWQLVEGTDTLEEIMLERIWGSPEKRMAFLAELGTNGGVTGDFYIQIVPPKPGEELPRVINLDPAIVFPHTDPNDIGKEWAFELRYPKGNDVWRTMHALRDDGASWETWDEMWSAGRWERTTERQLWPFPWPMIIHGKNLPHPNSYFGQSDLEDADLNDAINNVASNMNRIIRIFAHPLVWSRLFGKDSIAVDTSQMMLSQDPNAAMGALELGRDMNSAQDFSRFLRTSFAEVTGVPESDPERMAIGAQSGFALKVLFNDLILKTGIKRSLYGSALIEANRRLLDLMGLGDDHIVKLHWQDPLPLDERVEREGHQFDLDYALASRQTISEKRGYDYKAEQQRGIDEAASNTQSGDAATDSFPD